MMRKYALQLVVHGPVLSGSTATGTFGVDTPVVRDHRGRVLIPGAHLTGKLRQALKELLQAAEVIESEEGNGPGWNLLPVDIGQLFGEAAFADGDARKLLHISDLVAEDAEDAGSKRTRITLDAESGAAAEGMIQTLETPFASGSEVRFCGCLRFLGPDEDASATIEAIKRALHWIPQVGGNRTIGYGRVLRATLDAVEQDRLPVLPASADLKAERWQVVVRMREPFCIGQPHPDENTFSTRTVIPGGVLKGALARIMSAQSDLPADSAIEDNPDRTPMPTLAREFSRVRFTHLLPRPIADYSRIMLDRCGDQAVVAVVPPERSRQWPLSLVRARDELYDLALTSGLGLIHGEAPAFVHHWPDSAFGPINQKFGMAKPEVFLRVRTAINEGRRAAAAGQLFAYQMVVPDHHVWLGELDLAAVDVMLREVMVRELAALVENGVSGIGKTDAAAEILLSGPLPTAREDFDEDRFARRRQDQVIPRWVLVLRSPALLVPPDLLGPCPPYNARERLRKAYAQSFRELSEEHLDVVQVFTWHVLSGGVHQAARYMRARTYRPWLLTQAGSVIVLEPSSQQAPKPQQLEAIRGHLHSWRDHGLPIPPGVRRFYEMTEKRDDADLWRECPYIRHNGYGEILINMPEHIELSPGPVFQPFEVA